MLKKLRELLKKKTEINVLNYEIYPKICLCNIDEAINTDDETISAIMETLKKNVGKDRIWDFFKKNLKRAHQKIHALEAKKVKAEKVLEEEEKAEEELVAEAEAAVNKDKIKEDFYKKQDDEFLFWVKRNNAVNLEKDLKDFFLKKFSPEKYLIFLKINAILKYLLYCKIVAFEKDESGSEKEIVTD